MSNLSETNVGKLIQLALGKIPGVRMFRNNSGFCWIGQSKVFSKRTEVIVNPGDVLIKQGRPFHAGLCTGSSDFIGLKSITITPEHVGKTLAVFTAAEIKTKSGRATSEQIAFLNMVNKLGGIGFIATDENEAVEFINKKI